MDHLLLGMVERQSPEIFCLTGIGADYDIFDIALRKDDAERVARISLGVKRRVGCELFGQDNRRTDAVERVGLDAVLVNDAAGELPALAENFEKVGFDDYAGGRCGLCIRMIVEAEWGRSLESADYCGEMVAGRGHIFKKYFAGDIARRTENIVGGG